MEKSFTKVKKASNKFAAISAIWFAVIIAAAILLGEESGIFVQLLPLFCTGGFLSVIVELYMK
jgi:hypothetical protein